MSNRIEDFLTAAEEQEVIDAIRKAEKDTSGEIRVHIEHSSNGKLTERALEVFHILKMDNTKLQNGVLIYVAVTEKSFVIYGDKGINDIVSDNFWDHTKQHIEQHFKQGHFKQGLIDGILSAGKQLKTYFPANDINDNELPDYISSN